MDAVPPVAGLLAHIEPGAASMLPASVAAVPRRIGSARGDDGQEVEEASFTVVEEPPARRSSPSRRKRRAILAPLSAARDLLVLSRATRHTSTQREALHAYTPYRDDRGLYVDEWA